MTTGFFAPPSAIAVSSPEIWSIRFGAKYRWKLESLTASRARASVSWLFSMATAAIPEKAMRNSRSSSPKESVAVRLSTYRIPSTCPSLPINGQLMAERTLCIRMD